MSEIIVISSDHAGFDLKCHLKPLIESLGYAVEDVGAFSKEPVDYPVFTFKAAQKIISGECSRGIIFCGTGQGDAMVANKVPGIRAALCWNEFTARMSRAHNDANVLVLGGWVTGHKIAEEIVRIWLETPFDGGRHQRRISEISEIERLMKLERGKIYDITRSLSPLTLLWPGDAPITVKRVDFPGVNSMTNVSFSVHAGTHVDSPLHILKGAAGVDSFSIDQLLGLARVVCLSRVKTIDRALLETVTLDGITRILIRTNNSDLYSKPDFDKDFATLSEDAAKYLVEKGIRFLVVDYLSVDDFASTSYPVHRVLMEAGVAIVEGADLRGVPAGDYEMLCLPLKLENSDGAPARIILRSL